MHKNIYQRIKTHHKSLNMYGHYKIHCHEIRYTLEFLIHFKTICMTDDRLYLL